MDEIITIRINDAGEQFVTHQNNKFLQNDENQLCEWIKDIIKRKRSCIGRRYSDE